MREKHGWHIRFAAFGAALRMTPPHQTQTTCGPASPLCVSVSRVYDSINHYLKVTPKPSRMLSCRFDSSRVGCNAPTPPSTLMERSRRKTGL
jgi:hypothetical protein